MTDLATRTILEAAREQFALTGIRRTSADDIAKRAGLNRATLYRRIGTMSDIVAATYRHETQRVLAIINDIAGPIPAPGTMPGFDPAEYIEKFFAVTITELRNNALLQQLIKIDPDETLAGLTLRAGDTLTLAAAVVGERIAKLRAHTPSARIDDIEDLSATFARLAQSLVITPDAPPVLDTAAQMRAYARRIIAPLVLGSH